MHLIKSISIEGFRGSKKPLKLELSRDANFLIGRNGTGKTTLINLIHAGLSADVDVLKEIDFTKIEYKFSQKGNNTTPSVSVLRKEIEEVGTQLAYELKRSSKSKAELFELTGRVRKTIVSVDGTRRQLLVRPNRLQLRDTLRGLFSLTWLSLQRGGDKFESDDWEEDDEDATDVDRKLEQVISSLGGYFSRLDREVAEQTQIFQKNWFLSFLARDRTSIPNLTRIDLEEDKSTLEDIFTRFELEQEIYESALNRHFQLASAVINKNNSERTMRDYFVMADVERLHSLTRQWQSLQEKQKDIYGPKNRFTKTITEMLWKKHAVVDSSNRIRIISEPGSAVPIRSLSSGEKQLLIFLSETLLQEGRPYIFLADEPELSLHVEWQEELVPALLSVNPCAQVLFATHSPDIVNKYQANVIRMEDLV